MSLRIRNAHLDPAQEEQIELFRQRLKNYGYTSGSVTAYLRAAALYLTAGQEMTPEAIDKYFDEKYHEEGITKRKKSQLCTAKTGVKRFYELLYDDDGELNVAQKHLEKYGMEKVCNEDCFNCIYPDCIC